MKSYRISLTILLLLAAATFWFASKANRTDDTNKIQTAKQATVDSSAITFEKIVVTTERLKQIIFPEIIVTAPRPMTKEITNNSKRSTENAKPFISSSQSVKGGSELSRPWYSSNNGID